MSKEFKISILTILFLSLLTLNIYKIIYGPRGYIHLINLKNELASQEKANSLIEEENKKLSDKIKDLQLDETYIESIIREKLGLVKENEIVIQFQE